MRGDPVFSEIESKEKLTIYNIQNISPNGSWKKDITSQFNESSRSSYQYFKDFYCRKLKMCWTMSVFCAEKKTAFQRIRNFYTGVLPEDLNSKGERFGFQNNKMFSNSSETFAICCWYGRCFGARSAPKHLLFHFQTLPRFRRNWKDFVFWNQTNFAFGNQIFRMITYIKVPYSVKSCFLFSTKNAHSSAHF